MKWRRHRDAQPTISEQALADTWQVVSLLLDYPDDVLVSRVPMLRDVVARLADPLVAPLRRFIPLIGGVDLSPLAAIVLLQVAGMIAGSVLGSLIR